jgi:hypothetical protein
MTFNNPSSFYSSETVRAWWRLFCFCTLSIASILLEALPTWKHVGFSFSFFPLILFFCAIYYAGAMNYLSLVVLGIFADSLWEAPMGYSSLRYLILYVLLQTQASYFQQGGLIFGWLGFFIFSVLNIVSLELFNFCLNGQFLFPFSLILTQILMILFYPLGFICLHKIAKKIG